MSKVIKLKKGFDIKARGAAKRQVADVPYTETYAIKPTDFKGLGRQKLVVKEGDTVKAGSTLFYDKSDDRIQYTSPVSGEVVEVQRGAKRRLEMVKVLADSTIVYEDFKKHTISEVAGISREEAQESILKAGIWQQIIQRPYAVIADPDDTPQHIFISAFDTHPLAPNYDFLLKEDEQAFQTGITVLKKFTSGLIHLNLNNDAEVSHLFTSTKGVQLNKVSGPHPAGNVGVQIHHIAPISKNELIWTINPFGVVLIGRLFLEGRYDASKLVALAGSEVKNPQYYKTRIGACINKMVEGNLNSDHVRHISGNILTGRRIPADGYLGYYDNMVTVIKEGDYEEFLGWFDFGTKKLSFHRAWGLLSFLNPNKEYDLDTNIHGEPRAFVQTGVFEKVTPMDIYPTHLIKAILAEDYDDMEALGIYEVAEEDLALCEFVDVSKHNVQALVREGIELMRNS